MLEVVAANSSEDCKGVKWLEQEPCPAVTENDVDADKE